MTDSIQLRTHESVVSQELSNVNWPELADRVVNRTLQLQRGERVVYLADPYLHPECMEAVRYEVLKAGAVEQATILNWTPRLSTLRASDGTAGDLDAVELERRAHLDLMNTADVFIWLPNDFLRGATYSTWESEWILDRWRGRGLHFHWFPEPTSRLQDPINTELARIYQIAILDLDYTEHARLQRELVAAIKGRRLRVTTPDGTDLAFDLPLDGWYHTNDGEMSRERAATAVCARDREAELPCGAVRTVPAPAAVDGTVALRHRHAWNGTGLNLDQFASNLDLVFRDGHIVEMRGGDMQQELDMAQSKLTGDWDRLGEVVFGTNSLLTTPSGATMPTYWGFGAGTLRFHLGNNEESAGNYRSNLWINLWLTDATVTVDGENIIKDGILVFEAS